MTVGSDYADDLKHELLSEMAGSFFSRRRRLEEHLEAFNTLREKVSRQGLLALARWRTFRGLLLSGAPADQFLRELGFDPTTLATFPEHTEIHFRVFRPLALTAAGRYRKAVLAFYEGLRKELENYNEGGYAPDARDPRRMRRLPGYEHLMSVGQTLNAEIKAVNACQCPTDMIQFTKSLDPTRQEQEHACGGIAMGDACRLDRELSYKPLDLGALGVPQLPTPPLLESIKGTLSDLAAALHKTNPQAADAALAALR